MPHALAEHVTILIATREADRRYKLQPQQRALARWCTYSHAALARIAAGFGIGRHRPCLVTTVTSLLADRPPGLLKTPARGSPVFVLLDGTHAECDRIGDNRADHIWISRVRAEASVQPSIRRWGR